ncbi:MAG: hypothetical protein D6814_10670 [Calditrichaeota bacterium]|nr:MAG: hypothetical protein D6814_10670 [Calditrichota bacterium]
MRPTANRIQSRDQMDRRPSAPAMVWWLVAARECADLWKTGRVLALFIIYSVLLGGLSFLLATNRELSLMRPEEMVFLLVQICLAAGLLVSLIIGADCLSGERDRGTLEGLLLTPASRRQIVTGKYLAAVSPWPAILLISFPYMYLLSSKIVYFLHAVIWAVVGGSLLLIAFTGLAILISFWCQSNKSSLPASLLIYLLFLAPTQLPGAAKAGGIGKLMLQVNPIDAVNHFLSKILVNHYSPVSLASWLVAPAIFAMLVLVVLFFYASPGLQLAPGKGQNSRTSAVRASSLVLLIVFHCFLQPHDAAARQEETSSKLATHLQLNVDTAEKKVKTGDQFVFTTTVTNRGKTASADLIVALNIINLRPGDPVDPEDWSPQRVQYLGVLAPGKTSQQTWTIHAIFEGDYLVYMVLMGHPGNQTGSSRPLPGPGLHLTVEPFTRLNPAGILPLAIGMPVGLTLGMLFLRSYRRRQIDSG